MLRDVGEYVSIIAEQAGRERFFGGFHSVRLAFVNGERITGDQVLRAGDELGVGTTRLVFRAAQSDDASRTTLGVVGPPDVTRRERDLLVALCRPLRSGDAFAQPCSVKELAEALVVSEAAVKFHLSNLYEKFEIYEREGTWWMTITGDLFGPYTTDEEAIDAIPDALRTTF